MFENIFFYTLEECKQRLDAIPFEKPALVLEGFLAKAWGLEAYLEEKVQKGWCWVKQIDPNPTEESLHRALFRDGASAADAIVAVGGGSSIDLAKGISALSGLPGLDTPGDILAAVQGKTYVDNGENALPIFALPTTAGTGSEVTQWATLWGAATGAKYSIDAPWLTPAEAWIVPEVTLSLPPRLTLSTGLDAVAHASEAYWARKSNPLVQALSVRAVQLMVRYLPQVLKDPQNLELRTQVATGALLAGMAFSRTRTTAAHSMSYPLTSLFKVEHGFAAALTLPSVAKVNSQAVDCVPLFEVFQPYGGMQAWMDTTAEGLQTLRLSAYGITADDIPAVVENAFTAGRMDNNPVDLDKSQVQSILEGVL